MSIALPRERLEAALAKLPARWRSPVESIWRKEMRYRKSSELYANKYARLETKLKGEGLSRSQVAERLEKRGYGPPPTVEERALALRIREFLSYREIEEFLHLKPQSGNDAQRLCNSERERHRKPRTRMTTKEFRKLAEQFAATKPTKAKAVFKKIELEMHRHHNHMASAV